MLLRARSLAAALLVPALLLTGLAGCGSGDETAQTAEPAPTATAPSGITVTGAFGSRPGVTLTKEPAPTKLRAEVLTKGSGKPVAKGELLVANYLGELYANGTVFDSSWDRGQPAAFPIGAGAVIPGWDEGLVGQKAGSRVLLTIPPDKGYGARASEKIPANSTLVFVVDIVSSYGAGAAGQADAKLAKLPAGGPQVTGALGKRPAVTVPKGAAQPTASATAVVATGTGPVVEAGQLVVMQYEVVDWAGKPVESTWATRPYGGAVGVEGQPSPFDELVGQPVGSRVLVTTPAQQGQGGPRPAYAVAVDIVAAPS